ncbi:MAG: HD-GYP domain-containing protein, partial [Solirubrobacteraceae bacterium]
SKVAAVVRSHHERPDGRGYPDGLTAAQIPDTAAIVSVVDAWDAMVSDRPYRQGMPRDRARAILQGGAGSQWVGPAVETVLAELSERGPVLTPALERVGRTDGRGPRGDREDLVAACLPDLATFSPAT